MYKVYVIGFAWGVKRPGLPRVDFCSFVLHASRLSGQDACLLAHNGTVQSLLDVPERCAPRYCIVWHRFRLMRGFLAYRPNEVPKIMKMIGLIADSCA